MLPSLAPVADLTSRIDGGVPAADTVRAQANLDDASALIREAAGETWVDAITGQLTTVPDVVITVTIAAAKRAFLNPDSVQAESVDGYSQSHGSAGVYLTKEEKNLVRRAAGTLSGAGAVSLEGYIPTPESERFDDPFDEDLINGT